MFQNFSVCSFFNIIKTLLSVDFLKKVCIGQITYRRYLTMGYSVHVAFLLGRVAILIANLVLGKLIFFFKSVIKSVLDLSEKHCAYSLHVDCIEWGCSEPRIKLYSEFWLICVTIITGMFGYLLGKWHRLLAQQLF